MDYIYYKRDGKIYKRLPYISPFERDPEFGHHQKQVKNNKKAEKIKLLYIKFFRFFENLYYHKYIFRKPLDWYYRKKHLDYNYKYLYPVFSAKVVCPPFIYFKKLIGFYYIRSLILSRK